MGSELASFRRLSEEVYTRIKDLPRHERPRERLASEGAEKLRDCELLAILLRTGSKGYSAVNIAEQLLKQFGTLERLARAPLEDLQRVKGIGRDKAIALKSAFTLAQRMALRSSCVGLCRELVAHGVIGVAERPAEPLLS